MPKPGREKNTVKILCWKNAYHILKHRVELKAHLWNSNGSYWPVFTSHLKEMDELFHLVKKSAIESRCDRAGRYPHFSTFVDEGIEIPKKKFSLNTILVVVLKNIYVELVHLHSLFYFHCFCLILLTTRPCTVVPLHPWVPWLVWSTRVKMQIPRDDYTLPFY